jgi:hypothetical protein
LRRRWGARYVRIDRRDIPSGVNFHQAALKQIAESRYLLVLIGPGWAPERLANPRDFVREEIETALEKGVSVIPVLVNGASIPGADALPPSLLPLLGQKASDLSDGRWDYDVQLLASHMERRSRLWAWLLVLLVALVAAYALRGPIPLFPGEGSQPIPPSDSTDVADGKSSSPAETKDTATTDSLDGDSQPDSPSAPVPHLQSAPSPPPAPPPSPPAETRSRTASPPTTGPVVERESAQIGPDQFRSYELTITDSRPCRLRGRVEAIEGGSRDIDVLVLGEDDFRRFTRKPPETPILMRRRTSAITLDVPLPGPGRYYFVVSNYFSVFYGKLVLVENVRWECGEGGSDPPA